MHLVRSSLFFCFVVLVPTVGLASVVEPPSLVPGPTRQLKPRQHQIKPAHVVIRPGFDRLRVDVKFQDGFELDTGHAGSAELHAAVMNSRMMSVLHTIREAGGRWRSASTMNRTRLAQLRSRAQTATGREIADLSDYFTLALPPGANAERLIDALNELPEVEMAAPTPLRSPPPSVPDFEPLQGYLAPAIGGLDARFAWTIPGGTGTGVSICDMEYGWNLHHEDLPIATVLIPDGETLSEEPKNDHGTEVLGAMFSLPNGWGTTGASYDARCFVAPTYLDSGYSLFQQILWASAQLEPGDVILLEMQTAGPNFGADPTQFGYVPVEWEPAIYNAILTAVGNGIHVIEPAGNGGQNLDDPVYKAGNYGHAPFLPENNSGAIMVGAGIPPTAPELGPDRSRSVFSNYGSRLDVQGWGHRVTTTGAGDLYSAEGENLLYTRFFGGTSSAGPLVASAVASIEGISEHGTGASVPPRIMRALLRETGSPQQNGAHPASEEPIGPRPDLRAGIERMSRPLVAAPRVIHAFEGESIHFTVDAADLDGDPITNFAAGPLPSGATFSLSSGSTQGQIDWSTTAGQAGTYLLVFTASNAAGSSDTTRIEIESAEQSPVVRGPGGENGLESYPVEVSMNAIDPNGDPILSFVATNLPPGATFVVDSTNTTGVLRWVPGYDQAGQHIVSFEATSAPAGGPLETGHGFLILTIRNADRSPIVVAPDMEEGPEGALLTFTVTASDPDGEPVTSMSASNLPPGAHFEPNVSTQSGVFSWTPGFDQAGYYFVSFYAENAAYGGTESLIRIENVDRPPIVSASPRTHGMEGQELSIDVTATDPDDDRVLTFTAEGLPPGCQFTTDADRTSAHISWTPQSGQAGQYLLTLIATSRPPVGPSKADSAIVEISIEAGRFAARVFTQGTKNSIRLSSGAAHTCLHVEPMAGDFILDSVSASTLMLTWSGAPGEGALAEPAETYMTTDADHNGIADLEICFAKEALRDLFDSLESPHQAVQVGITGRLQNGGTVEGSIELDILSQRGMAFVTPNPSRQNPVLSFYTSKLASIRLGIFDSRGRLVRAVLDQSEWRSGFHDVPLGSGLPVGVYYYKLETSDGEHTGKFILLR